VAGIEPIVAIVAKAPRAGEVKTRLCPPLAPDEAAALHHAFLGDTVELVAGMSGARGALVFTPAVDEGYFSGLAPAFVRVAQQGRDLGARLHHAFGALFATGAPAVVAIGADAPTLPAMFIADALARLTDRHADVVLGPTDDGGYYLVGMTRVHPALFDAIPWSTPAVLDTTLARADEVGLDVSLLPSWFDVDLPADLGRLESSLGDSSVSAPRTRAMLRARVAARA
jgi:hypothetical protein